MNIINNCPESKYYYEKGCRQRKTGRILSIWIPIGCVTTGAAIGGIVGISWGDGLRVGVGAAIGAVAGGVSALTSIPFFASGKYKKNNAYQVYNEYCAKPTAMLSFGPATKGIGMGVYLNF